MECRKFSATDTPDLPQASTVEYRAAVLSPTGVDSETDPACPEFLLERIQSPCAFAAAESVGVEVHSQVPIVSLRHLNGDLATSIAAGCGEEARCPPNHSRRETDPCACPGRELKRSRLQVLLPGLDDFPGKRRDFDLVAHR